MIPRLHTELVSDLRTTEGKLDCLAAAGRGGSPAILSERRSVKRREKIRGAVSSSWERSQHPGLPDGCWRRASEVPPDTGPEQRQNRGKRRKRRL